MFEIKIDGKVIGFPERLTISQWMRLARWDVSSHENWPFIIGTILQVHPKDIEEVPEGQQELLVGFTVNLMNRRLESKMLDLSGITFGEWVDLDVWTAEGFDKSLLKCLTILGETEWADEALWKIEKWLDYRTYVYRQYAEMFGLTEEGELQVEDEDSEPKSHEDIIAGWYTIICGLASEDVLRIDSITKQPLLSIFNFMAHQKRKQIAENFQKLKQQREYELQRNRR